MEVSRIGTAKYRTPPHQIRLGGCALRVAYFKIFVQVLLVYVLCRLKLTNSEVNNPTCPAEFSLAVACQGPKVFSHATVLKSGLK